jgi:hypothetical protein
VKQVFQSDVAIHLAAHAIGDRVDDPRAVQRRKFRCVSKLFTSSNLVAGHAFESDSSESAPAARLDEHIQAAADSVFNCSS